MQFLKLVTLKTLMLNKKGKKGFTLLEVVIALAVFGFLVGGLLGFLPWGVEGVGKVREQNIAYGLVDAVEIELERAGFSICEAGTSRLSGMYEQNSDPVSDTEEFNLLLVARKEGGAVVFEQVVKKEEIAYLNDPNNLNEGTEIVSSEKDSGGTVYFNNTLGQSAVSLNGYEDIDKTTAPQSYRWIPQSERYFLIKCRQYPLGHRHQHHPSNGYLALQMDVQWPYKVPDPSQAEEDGFRRIAERYRSHFRFPIAVNR